MSALRLRARLLVRRYGWLPIVATFLTAAGLWLHFVILPELAAGVAAERRMLARLKAEAASPTVPATPLIERRYREFRDHLARRETLPDIIKTFFAVASRHGLALQRMEYSQARPAGGEYLVYRITAPLTGSYAAVRQFAEDILEKLPAAALEEAAFKRDAIGTTATEARLRFALYLREDK